MKHLAIIPDGNRRWATSQGLSVSAGHEISARYERLKELLETAREEDVEYFSLWAFSTENWKRSESERKILFMLLRGVLKRLINDAVPNGIRFRWLGRRDRIPGNLVSLLEELETLTKDCNKMNLQLCLDYGGRDELVRAVNLAVVDGTQMTEQTFGNLLDTQGVPDPDIVIRTGGEKRLSGFMSYQAAYAELFFQEKFFPEFTAEDLKGIITEYKSRDRRYGGG